MVIVLLNLVCENRVTLSSCDEERLSVFMRLSVCVRMCVCVCVYVCVTSAISQRFRAPRPSSIHHRVMSTPVSEKNPFSYIFYIF